MKQELYIKKENKLHMLVAGGAFIGSLGSIILNTTGYLTNNPELNEVAKYIGISCVPYMFATLFSEKQYKELSPKALEEIIAKK